MKLSDIKAKILIVDDDTDIRSAVRLTLKSEPGVTYTFSEAGDVEAGLKAFKSAKPDVVVLDLHMPGKNGFEFIDKLKENDSFLQTKVIILTAHDNVKNLWKAESKGVDAYHFMSKPFVNEDLRALVLGLALP